MKDVTQQSALFTLCFMHESLYPLLDPKYEFSFLDLSDDYNTMPLPYAITYRFSL